MASRLFEGTDAAEATAEAPSANAPFDAAAPSPAASPTASAASAAPTTSAALPAASPCDQPGYGSVPFAEHRSTTPTAKATPPHTMPATGAAVNGTSAPVFVPGSTIPTVNTPADPETSAPSTGYTEVTSDLYYSGGHLGTLKIPAIGLTVKVYEGTDSKTLAKGAGHFEETSIWRGNIAVAAHNRGTNNHFGKIHTLELGDEITLTTKLGTRTYEVVSVSKVLETDRSGLAATTENMITLYTCVMNQRDYRWCVKAVEI